MRIFGGLLGAALVLALVSAAPAAQRQDTGTAREIDHLLEYVGGSDCRFNRNNEEHSAAEARAHLAKKYRYLASRIDSAEAFIERAASRSSISGQPYLVQCDGETRTSREWLQRELNRFRAAEKTGEGGNSGN